VTNDLVLQQYIETFKGNSTGKQLSIFHFLANILEIIQKTQTHLKICWSLCPNRAIANEKIKLYFQGKLQKWKKM
jgi:hypothetical protein